MSSSRDKGLEIKLIISQEQFSFFFAFILLAKEDGMAITAHREKTGWPLLPTGKVSETCYFLEPQLKCSDFYIKCQRGVMEI
jgi:hypothetical protein